MELRLENDPRLVAGVVRAVEHFAARAGFGAAESRALGEAAGQACRDSFEKTEDPAATVGVYVQLLPDRIEIAVEHAGEAGPAAGLETFGAAGGMGAGLALLSRVDRLQYQSGNGVSRLILTKYVSAAR